MRERDLEISGAGRSRTGLRTYRGAEYGFDHELRSIGQPVFDHQWKSTLAPFLRCLRLESSFELHDSSRQETSGLSLQRLRSEEKRSKRSDQKENEMKAKSNQCLVGGFGFSAAFSAASAAGVS